MNWHLQARVTLYVKQHKLTIERVDNYYKFKYRLTDIFLLNPCYRTNSIERVKTLIYENSYL